MSGVRATALLLLAACFAACGRSPVDARPAAPPSTGDLGHFVVTGVLIDPALDTMQQRYFRDDPRLLGRLITVAAGRVGVDGDPLCTQVQRRWTRQPVDTVLKTHSQRRGDAAARPPRAADYDLRHAPTGPVATVQYQCTAPTSPTERAICADPVLAGWDRSVATAYTLGLKGSDKGEGWVPADDPAALQASQRDWIAERDRCGTDRDCLLDRMYARTDALMRRQYR